MPGLPKDLRIISPQGIRASVGYKGNFIYNFNDEHDGYAELNLKENNPGWKKVEPVERFYVNYDPKKNPPTHEYTLPSQREKEVKSLASSVCVTN